MRNLSTGIAILLTATGTALLEDNISWASNSNGLLGKGPGSIDSKKPEPIPVQSYGYTAGRQPNIGQAPMSSESFEVNILLVSMQKKATA